MTPRRHPPLRPSAAERGATVIPDKVVARIAARAAYEAMTQQVARPLAHHGLSTPTSSAEVHKGSAHLEVSLDLAYPVDIARASREIGRFIAERVAHLTGMHVTGTTLIIRRLVPRESLRHGRVN